VKLAAVDPLLRMGLRSLALVSGLIVLLILLLLLHEAAPALAAIGAGQWLIDPGWQPSAGRYNLLPMIAGSALVALGALLLAVPLGLGAALFAQFYAPPGLARLWRRALELMAGIPSVVYGFWALVVLVPMIRMLAPPGQSLLAGMLVLALMILPTVAVTADAALAALPRALISAARALGLGRVSRITRIALPAARAGILTGIVLALGRALGETLAVLMVAGNVVQVPDSLFDPFRALTANIALEMAYAAELHRSALFVCGLVLFAITVGLVLIASRLSPQRLPHAA
jgi:phosphate transport system permease protein